MNIDIIKNTICESEQLNEMLLMMENLAIIEYNGVNIDGCRAISAYLDENNIEKGVVKNIVLLGKKNKAIRNNNSILNVMFPEANIIIPNQDWRDIDPHEINIHNTCVLHMIMEVGQLMEDIRQNITYSKQITKLFRNTRSAYFAALYKSLPKGADTHKVILLGQLGLSNLVFMEDTNKVQPTTYCLERSQYLNMFLKNTSEKDMFFLAVDEVENGCNICNQASKYGHRKQCPLAQRQVAKCYRDGIYVPKDETIAHQWEVMASRQGYKPAKIQVADDLAEGIGCDKNIEDAIQIYNEFALFQGNEDCANKIIDIVENNCDYDPIIALPHIVRKANAGDQDMIYKLAEAYKNGEFGLPKDAQRQKFWIERGAESGEIRFIEAMAKMYEESESFDSAIIWYSKLNEADLFVDYSEKIEELQNKLLEFDRLSANEIAEKGFDFLCGHNIEENHHLAYLCFKYSAESNDGLGLRGLAFCYFYGYDVEQDEDYAYELTEKAAENGNLRSMKLLYEHNNGQVYIDEDKQNALLDRFSKQLSVDLENKDKRAYAILSECYAEGSMSFEKDDTKAFEASLKALELGDPHSLLDIGDSYFKGSGVEQNVSKAFEYYMKASNVGLSEGKYAAGYCYYKGVGTSCNFIKAFNLLTNAANRNHTYAKYYLGECYLYGKGTNKNEEKAYGLIVESAESGCSVAQVKLCEDYFNGRHFKKNYERCIFWGEKALAQEQSSVRFEVAYSSKELGKINRARELYTELANEGDIAAMNNLGCLENDKSLSVEWFTKAADKGNKVAQCNIGRYYKNGTSVEQDYDKAKEYFEKSAAQGYHCAMYELALFYRYGYGVDINADLMVSWYSKAIEKGNKYAMIDLAECYKNGSIVRQDYGESMKYYQMAAELDKIDDNTKDTNQLKALFTIGTFYENGYGVDKNSSKAIFWYRKAANKNYTPAQEALKRLDTNWVDETGHATIGKENNNINDDLPF